MVQGSPPPLSGSTTKKFKNLCVTSLIGCQFQRSMVNLMGMIPPSLALFTTIKLIIFHFTLMIF